MYYLRTRPAANPIQFTVDKKRLAVSRALNETNGYPIDQSKNDINIKTPTTDDLALQMAGLVCSLDNKEDCMMCGA